MSINQYIVPQYVILYQTRARTGDIQKQCLQRLGPSNAIGKVPGIVRIDIPYNFAVLAVWIHQPGI